MPFCTTDLMSDYVSTLSCNLHHIMLQNTLRFHVRGSQKNVVQVQVVLV